MAEAPLIFVSCGQYTVEEKQLGKDVCLLISKNTAFEPYFAENQSDFEGLSRHILGAMERAFGLVAIMHPRGKVTYDGGLELVRASVWIEQEIAIAAFITQVLKRPLRVAAYVHEGIALEGMRQQLILNPVPFSRPQEVLIDLATRIRSWIPSLAPRNQVELLFENQPVSQPGGLVGQELTVKVQNASHSTVSKYHVNLEIPKHLLEHNSTHYWHELGERRTAEYRFFRIPHSSQPPTIVLPDDRQSCSESPWLG